MHRLGMCPDWDSNPQPFDIQDSIPIYSENMPETEAYLIFSVANSSF